MGDPTAVPDLLGQITTPFESFMGDGAYDGDPVSKTVLAKQLDARVVVPRFITQERSTVRRRNYLAGPAYRNHCSKRADRLAADNRLQFPQLCRTGDAALQAHLRQYDEIPCTCVAENGGVGQCVRTEQDD